MRFIDCFIFYNELDMLEYRLHNLYKYIDYFVLVESTKTFIGKNKQLYYNENKERYKKYADKIIHIIVDDLKSETNLDIKLEEQWDNEKYQRNCIDRGLIQLKLHDEDIILISDVDEIPNTNAIKYVRENNNELKEKFECMKLSMDFYYYNINCKIISERWEKAIMVYYNVYKETRCPELYRNINKNNDKIGVITNGGWHLSYFGNIEFIKNKIKNFSHQEFNQEHILNQIKESIENNNDIFMREYVQMINIKIEDNLFLPENYEFFYLLNSN